MPGAWAALRPELATPRGADTNYYDQRERLSQRKFPSQSAGGRTTPRAGTASHRSSNRRQQNQTPAAEQLWEQAERSLRAEDSGYDHKWEDQSSSFMHEQPQPYQQPPPPPLPYQQPAYTTMPSPGVAVGQAPAQWAGDHSRSPLPIARSAVRASSLTPTPRADQVIILSGGESHPTSLVQLWRSNAYSDVDVIVEGQAFYAHRLVLAAGSEFLSSLVESSPPLNMRCASVHRRACCAHAIHRRPSITFHPPPVIHCMPSAAAPAVRCVSDSPSLSSRVSASQRRASVLELPGVTADAFEIVLEWLYCGEVSLVPHMLPKSPLASCASMAFADCPSCFSIAQVGLVPHMLPGLLDAAVRLEVTSLQVRHLPTPPHIHAHLPPSMAFRISDPSTPISHLNPSTPISHLGPSTPTSHLRWPSASLTHPRPSPTLSHPRPSLTLSHPRPSLTLAHPRPSRSRGRSPVPSRTTSTPTRVSSPGRRQRPRGFRHSRRRRRRSRCANLTPSSTQTLLPSSPPNGCVLCSLTQGSTRPSRRCSLAGWSPG